MGFLLGRLWGVIGTRLFSVIHALQPNYVIVVIKCQLYFSKSSDANCIALPNPFSPFCQQKFSWIASCHCKLSPCQVENLHSCSTFRLHRTDRTHLIKTFKGSLLTYDCILSSGKISWLMIMKYKWDFLFLGSELGMLTWHASVASIP